MLGLIDFIFDNLFIVVLVISGLLGLLNSNNKDNKRTTNPKRPTINRELERRTTNPPRPNASPSKPRADRNPVQKEQQMVSFEEERREQLEQLKSQFNMTVDATAMEKELHRASIDDPHRALKRFNELERDHHLTEKQRELKKQMSGNITRKGLINGIIMAEVLGPPRSRKPYRSITEERFIK